MEITQNQTNTTNTPNINPPSVESLTTEKTKVPKRRFRLPHLSPRSFFISFLVLLLLLVLGLTMVTAVKNIFKKDFQSPAASPTAQFEPARLVFPHLPVICQKEPESSQCEQGFKALLDEECGGDIDAPSCSEIKKEALAFAQQDECQKDPNSPKCKCLKSGNLDSPECNSPDLINQAFISQLQEECQKDPSSSICNCINDADPPRCFGKALIGESLGQAFCEIAKYDYFNISAFGDLCQKFGGIQTSDGTVFLSPVPSQSYIPVMSLDDLCNNFSKIELEPIQGNHKLVYDRQQKKLFFKVKNTGEVDITGFIFKVDGFFNSQDEKITINYKVPSILVPINRPDIGKVGMDFVVKDIDLFKNTTIRKGESFTATLPADLPAHLVDVQIVVYPSVNFGGLNGVCFYNFATTRVCFDGSEDC